MSVAESNNLIDVDPHESTTNDLIPVVIRLFQVIRRRKRVVFSTLYCFALVGVAYYILAPRLYESTAKLHIVEQKIDSLSSVGEHDSSGKTMATHRELVTSPVVIKQAISKLQPQHRIDLKGKPTKEWVQTISEGLSARTTRKTNIIDVNYRSHNPETAAAIVRAVVQSYLNFVAENHQGAAGELIKVLSVNRKQLQEELQVKQEELQRFRQQAGHLAVSSDDGIVEPLIQRAIRLNEAMLAAQEKRLEIQANLSSVEHAIRHGQDVSQLLMSIEETLGRQILLSSMGLSPQDLKVLSDQQNKLLAVQSELQSLAVDYGPNHPRVINLQQEQKNLEQFLSSYHTGADGRFNSMEKSVPREMIVQMLRQSLQQAHQKEDKLRESFDEARAEAAEHSDVIVQLKMLEREVARNEALKDSLSEKIDSVDLGQLQAPIKAIVIREPLPNDVPVTPQLKLLVAVCLMGGTLCGCLIVYIQDILDDRFNSPEEITSQLGVPVLAMVRSLEPLEGVGFESVHTHVMPNATETEAFRTLRTALALGGQQCDRILVSSSEPGDGKTTISANLSVALAQAGKRTLVIDADLRRPGLLP